MKKLIILFATMAAIASGWFLWDLMKDRSQTVKILNPTPLYEEWGAISSTPSIGTVEPGEKLKVLRIRYGKEFQYIKIERPDGSTGWIMSGIGVELGHD